MSTSPASQTLIEDLHDKAVRQLVAAHRQFTDEPLVLAVRFALDDLANVHLLEVLDRFPGGDDDELLVTEFEPSANLRIVGKLRLVIGSPAQTRSAIRRGDTITSQLRAGQLVFEDGTPQAASLKRALGL